MTTTRIALVSSLVMLLGGCASGGPRFFQQMFRDAPVECNRQQCEVLVSVKRKPGGCESSVNIETLKTTHPGPVLITWTIPREGAFVDKAGRRGDGVDTLDKPAFHGRAHAAKSFKWNFRNEDRGKGNEWKYDVYTSLDGVPCDKLDPYVMN